MANINEKATVEFIINNSQAKQKLEEINRLLLEAKNNLKAASTNGDTKSVNKYRKEIAKLENEQRKMESRTQSIRRALENMDKAKPTELRKTIKDINAELNSGAVERNSQEWKALNEKLRQCKAELKGIQEEQEAAIDAKGGGIAEWGKKWVGLTTVVSQVAGAFQSAMGTLRGYVEEYAELAEHMANVSKYTGLAKEDVDDLNESFKKMDTRTAINDLNDLAADAGRLGIQSKQQVLEFVEAADQINVALGEDLGEDAVKNIGKLAQMFGDADSMGLKKAMLATGSVINELAQSSSANEGYIMEFTQRLAGVGKQAGMTQAQIMGLASVLDQNSVQAEVGATALSRIIQMLYQNTAKMAQAAGLDVKQFTQTLKTDANAALIQFAQGMNNLGGMEGMAPVLKDLSLTGSGVSQTPMSASSRATT